MEEPSEVSTVAFEKFAKAESEGCGPETVSHETATRPAS